MSTITIIADHAHFKGVVEYKEEEEAFCVLHLSLACKVLSQKEILPTTLVGWYLGMTRI